MVRLEKVILDNLRLEPEKPCLWWEGKWWTNGDLLRLVEESTKGLEKGGFRAGYRLAVLLPNSPRAGPVPCGLEPRRGYFAPERNPVSRPSWGPWTLWNPAPWSSPPASTS